MARDSRPGNRRLRGKQCVAPPRFPFQRGALRRPELVSEFTPGSVPPESVRSARHAAFPLFPGDHLCAPSLRWPKPSLLCVTGGEQQRSLDLRGGVRPSSNKEEEEHLVPEPYQEEANTHKAKEKKKQKAKQLFAESST